MSVETILAALGLSKASVITGAIGAALAAVQGVNRTVLQRVMNFIGGFCCAAWGTALAAHYFQIGAEAVGVYGAIGFVLGYFGMTLMDAGQQVTLTLKALDWNEILRSWLKRSGRGGGGDFGG